MTAKIRKMFTKRNDNKEAKNRSKNLTQEIVSVAYFEVLETEYICRPPEKVI